MNAGRVFLRPATHAGLTDFAKAVAGENLPADRALNDAEH